MGTTCGWITAECAVADLVAGMVSAWPDLEEVERVAPTTMAVVYERHRALIGVHDGPILFPLAFHAQGRRAVCTDISAARPFDASGLAELSKLVGPTLALYVGEHGGVAGFGFYESGACQRHVSYDGVEAELVGAPIAE